MALPENPVTRTEKFLAKIAGQDVELPPDDGRGTRTEEYLRYIAENGGSGGDVTKEYVDSQIQQVRTDTAELLDDYVEKEPEKGLSTNDYTDEEKQTVADSKAFRGTRAEFEALTAEQQAEYKTRLFTDVIDTLAGYGITDAYTKAETDALLADKTDLTIFTRGQAKLNAIANGTYEGEALTDLFANEIKADYDDEWQFVHGRIARKDYSGINVADFIPTTVKTYTMNPQIMGIKAYTTYGDTPVPDCIDFCTKETYPELHPMNKVNYNNGTSESPHPWLASDFYYWFNSLSGKVPNSTTADPELVDVDYTTDGVYYFLPQALKNVIIEKKFLLPTRYSASGLLTDDNSWAWKNIGKLWLPDECEVYGMPVWGGKGGYSLGGSGLQYPLFAGNMNRLKFRNGSRYHWWLLSPFSGDSTYWCAVYYNGYCGGYASDSDIAAPVCFRVA